MFIVGPAELGSRKANLVTDIQSYKQLKVKKRERQQCMGSLNNENKDEIRIFPNTIHKNTRSKWEGGDYDILEENIHRTHFDIHHRKSRS